ncbi:MAG: DUF4157 domain-containing protein [Bacteroidia bacterium]|nr:DUF4157 domain-containing protein [Bacteroidia bacterium]
MQESMIESPRMNRLQALQYMADKKSENSFVAQLKYLTARAPAKNWPDSQNGSSIGLPKTLKSSLENHSGFSMDQVKVHYNSEQPAQLHALAFARGEDIHLAPGQEKHLPHEAWHLVQQKAGKVKPTQQMEVGRGGEVQINDDPALEREADQMGARLLSSVNSPDSATPTRLTQSAGQNTVQRIIVGNYFFRGNENDVLSLDYVLNYFAQRGELTQEYVDFITWWHNSREIISMQDLMSNFYSRLERWRQDHPTILPMETSSDEDERMNDESSDLETFLSESDDDFQDINTIKIVGRRKIDKTRHVSNNAQRHQFISTHQLEADATTIHLAGGGDSRLTIVCVQFKTRRGDYIRVAVANDKTMPLKARQKAEEIGYSVIQGIKTHGETNLVIYARKHYKDLRYAGHGCDKGACRQCEENLLDEFGEDVDYGSKGKTGKYSGTYYLEGINKIKSTSLNNLQRNVKFNYDKKGKLLRKIKEQREQDILRNRIVSTRMNANNCLIQAIANAAGIRFSNNQLIRIRLRLNILGHGIGEMLVANNQTVGIIMEELGLGRDVTVHHNLNVNNIPNETLGNNHDNDPLDIYHTGQYHFQAEQPRNGHYY